MVTLYYYTTPVKVPESLVDRYLLRTGWFRVPTTGTVYPNYLGRISATNDSRASGVMPTPAPKVLSTVSTLQSGHGWVVSGALSSNLNDTTQPVLGTQCATFTSNTNAAAATLTKSSLTLDLTGTRQLRLLVKVTNIDMLQGLLLYVSSDNMVANFTAINIQSAQTDPNIRWLKEGEWKWVTVNLASGVATGTPNFAAVDSLRLRVTSTSGKSSTVAVQAVQVIERKSFASAGVVCFTYDDSYRNQYAVAKQHLDKYGFPGTAFTITSNVRDGDAGNTTWLTTAMLQDLHNYSGWEVALHANTLAEHARGFSGATNADTGTVYGTDPLTDAELDASITAQIDWIMSYGLSNGFLGHCYPQGRFNNRVRHQMRNRLAYARANTGVTNGMETLPMADPYAIRSYYLDNTTVLATEQARIDACAANGGLLVYTAHDIVTSPTLSTQVSTANHLGIVDYAAGKAGLRVMTLKDVMASLTAQG